ncbi:hypothetical protein ACKKBG_A06075 [Auxenochlorella protothecoides x Auxenochlorella symbiontica]
MKWTVAFLGLLALTSAALGETTHNRRSITGDDVQHALTDFINSIRTELHSKDTHESSRRRLQSWTFAENIHAFFKDVLGSAWDKFVPDAWKDAGFSWSKLGDFEYTSNLQTFLSETNLNTLAKPQTLAQLHSNLEKLEETFCTPEEFVPPSLTPSSCTGPSITLSYIPKKCVVNDIAKQILCTTPKLMLYKFPGSCSHKHWTPTTWTGKECKIAGKVGFTQEVIIGGGEYTLPLSGEDDD